jgi:hypothetical protein
MGGNQRAPEDESLLMGPHRFGKPVAHVMQDGDEVVGHPDRTLRVHEQVRRLDVAVQDAL